MKKALFIITILLAVGTVSRAQAYVPAPVVPEAVAAPDSLIGTQSLQRAGKSGRWYLGLGGGVHYNSRSGMYINVCPDISYRFNNTVFLGSQFSYSFDSGRSTVGVAPYARLHIVPLGKAITLYVTAYAPCSLSRNRLQLGFSAKPGIGIRVFPGVYFMGSFGTLGYTYIRTGDSIASGWGSNFSTDTIDLGFFLNL